MAAGGPQHSSVRPVGPVYLIERFPGLHQELMTLLRGLKDADWSRPTACALWSVKEKPSTRRDIIKMRLQPDDGFAGKGIKVSVRPECFTGGIEGIEWPMRKRFDEFDYGYVLTVHKAQGSQWDDVVLFDESAIFAESRQRWLYTGVTRAAKRLTVVM